MRNITMVTLVALAAGCGGTEEATPVGAEYAARSAALCRDAGGEPSQFSWANHTTFEANVTTGCHFPSPLGPDAGEPRE